MTKTTIILTMTILIAGMITPALNNASVFAATNIVTNGSFEDPDIPANSWSLWTSISGWTSTNTLPIEVRDNVVGSASDGDQYVELDSTGNSGISQTVSTMSGASYVLSFDYSPRIGEPSSTNTIEAYWDGVLIDSLTGDGSTANVWTTHPYNVMASDTSAILEFKATGTNDSFGGNLDNVSLTLSECPEGYEVNGDTCVLSNQDPICDVTSNVTALWPPNHKMVSISLVGGSDPDGDELITTVTGVEQDESTNELGDGDKSPDATLEPLQVRSERSGTGDGRVYVISYTLDDGNGGSCEGSVTIGVPHSVKKPAVDSVIRFDSTS